MKLSRPTHPYVPLAGGLFSYLAILMDRFSRRIVGWQMAQDMTEKLVLNVLRIAIRTRQPNPGLIHHTDRGGQYAGGAYRAVLRRAQIQQSMSRADNGYDNAFMDPCFGSIKTELEMAEYENDGEVLREVRQYIAYYHLERKHSSIGYLAPDLLPDRWSMDYENQKVDSGHGKRDPHAPTSRQLPNSHFQTRARAHQ